MTGVVRFITRQLHSRILDPLVSIRCTLPPPFWEVTASLSKGLVTNYGEGGLQNGRGALEVLPLRKGGGGNFSHAEARGGGHKKF